MVVGKTLKAASTPKETGKQKGAEVPAKVSVPGKKCAREKIYDRIPLAVSALQKHMVGKESKSLFPDIDQAVFVSVNYKKASLVVEGLRKKIYLPHTTKTLENTSICLIMPDLDRSQAARVDPDVDKQAREWADKLEEDHGVIVGKHISKIYTKRQLERELQTFQDRRAKATAYDIFMVDSRVHKTVHAYLGSEFLAKHKTPIPFRYQQPLTTQIEHALKTVYYNRLPCHKTVSVTCGHLGMSTKDLSENVKEVVDRSIELVPAGFVNLQAIFLHPCGCKPQLPIHFSIGPKSKVNLPIPKQVDENDRGEFVEVDSLPDGLMGEMMPNGEMHVVRETDKKRVVYPTLNDEWEEDDDLKPKFDTAKLEKKAAAEAKKMEKKSEKRKKRRERKKLAIKVAKGEVVAETKVSTEEPKPAKKHSKKVKPAEEAPAPTVKKVLKKKVAATSEVAVPKKKKKIPV